jgi:hypothetical protein
MPLPALAGGAGPPVEDPEAGEHGLVNLAIARALQEKAASLEHQLTHREKNPYCHVCQMTKTRDARSFRCDRERATSHWGELFACDHVDCSDERTQGFEG